MTKPPPKPDLRRSPNGTSRTWEAPCPHCPKVFTGRNRTAIKIDYYTHGTRTHGWTIPT